MTEPQQPDTADRAVHRDVDVPMDLDADRDVPGNEDVAPDSGGVEPPD